MKERLHEIDLLRPIVIFLLVVVHSFTMYWGMWSLPEGIGECRPYYWIAKLSYSCMLETFTFISGYLFALSAEHKTIFFRDVVIKKSKRLIIPSIIFSFLYLIFIMNERNVFSTTFLYNLINGVGHMWYLPMLFWCFAITVVLRKLPMKEEVKLAGLFLATSLSLLPLPLQLGSACYFLFFFYLGTYFFRKRDYIKQHSFIKPMMIFFTAIILIYVFFKKNPYLLPAIPLLERLYPILWRAFYTFFGVFILYKLCLFFTSRHKLPVRLIDFNKYCFGIYLIQQFILQILYYKTNLPAMAGTYWLPWCGLIITFFSSTILSKLLLKTRIGRFLIG